MKHPIHIIQRHVTLFLAGSALLGIGCKNQLVFTTATKFGVDISQQASQTPHVVFGYDRAEVALVPVPEKPQDRDANETKDAYSILSAFYLKFDNGLSGTDGLEMRQIIATGNAARKAATNTELSNVLTKVVVK